MILDSIAQVRQRTAPQQTSKVDSDVPVGALMAAGLLVATAFTLASLVVASLIAATVFGRSAPAAAWVLIVGVTVTLSCAACWATQPLVTRVVRTLLRGSDSGNTVEDPAPVDGDAAVPVAGTRRR